jgi:transposase
MLRLPESVRIYVASGPTDMRKQSDGLSGVVRTALGEEPKSGNLFVFFNRQRDIIRILFYDTNGFCVVSKKLEAGRFRGVDMSEGVAKASIDAKQLAEVLSTVERARVRQRRLSTH